VLLKPPPSDPTLLKPLIEQAEKVLEYFTSRLTNLLRLKLLLKQARDPLLQSAEAFAFLIPQFKEVCESLTQPVPPDDLIREYISDPELERLNGQGGNLPALLAQEKLKVRLDAMKKALDGLRTAAQVQPQSEFPASIPEKDTSRRAGFGPLKASRKLSTAASLETHQAPVTVAGTDSRPSGGPVGPYAPRGKLDERAAIELTRNPALTHVQLANMLGCSPRTLVDRRKCPLLFAAKAKIKAQKNEFRDGDKWSDRRADDD
jgi:hypothetical protein